MPLDAFLQRLRFLPIAVVFVIQAGAALFACETDGLELMVLLVATGVLLIPAFLWLRASSAGGVFGACCGLLPWLVWEIYIDCVAPYRGGGASMAYVAVFLWGIPSSVVCGVLFEHLQRKVLSSANR